jgi:hypothetical protein
MLLVSMNGRQILLALALTLAGCWSSPEGIDPRTTTLAATTATPSIVLSPGDWALHDLLVAADEAWEAAGVAPDRIVVTDPDATGSSRWLADTLAVGEACDAPGHNLDACSTYPGLSIVVAATLDDTRASVAVLHEMGHLLHGLPDNSHLDGCPEKGPGDSVMCPGAAPTPTLTERDAAFAGR